MNGTFTTSEAWSAPFTCRLVHEGIHGAPAAGRSVPADVGVRTILTLCDSQALQPAHAVTGTDRTAGHHVGGADVLRLHLSGIGGSILMQPAVRQAVGLAALQIVTCQAGDCGVVQVHRAHGLTDAPRLVEAQGPWAKGCPDPAEAAVPAGRGRRADGHAPA